MERRSQHVVVRGEKWAVRRTGSKRVTRLFDTKEEALNLARKLAIEQRCKVLIHGPGLFVQDYESYEKETSASTG